MAPNGSSSSSSGRSASMVRRKATRWRMPPESWAGQAVSKPGEAEFRKPGGSRAPGFAPGLTVHLEGEGSIVEGRAPGQQQVTLPHVGERPSRSRCANGFATPSSNTVPVVSAKSPEMMSSRVLLPEPDGPIRATNSPSAISKEMSSRASNVSPRST